jgi:hypothetical protein
MWVADGARMGWTRKRVYICNYPGEISWDGSTWKTEIKIS